MAVFFWNELQDNLMKNKNFLNKIILPIGDMEVCCKGYEVIQLYYILYLLKQQALW